jgi:glutathione S-transferase
VATLQRNLEEWADENLLWHFNRWQHLQRASAPEPGEAAGAWRALVQRVRPLRRLLAWLAAGGTWERPETAILRSLSDRLDDLVQFLGSRSYFYSERISMADLGVYAMLHTMHGDLIPGTSRLLAQRPALLEFMRRVERKTEDDAELPPV